MQRIPVREKKSRIIVFDQLFNIQQQITGFQNAMKAGLMGDFRLSEKTGLIVLHNRFLLNFFPLLYL